MPRRNGASGRRDWRRPHPCIRAPQGRRQAFEALGRIVALVRFGVDDGADCCSIPGRLPRWDGNPGAGLAPWTMAFGPCRQKQDRILRWDGEELLCERRYAKEATVFWFTLWPWACGAPSCGSFSTSSEPLDPRAAAGRHRPRRRGFPGDRHGPIFRSPWRPIRHVNLPAPATIGPRRRRKSRAGSVAGCPRPPAPRCRRFAAPASPRQSRRFARP